MLINFWDRSALGFAATSVMRDLRLSHAAFGALGSGFYLLFAVSALGFGWLSDRMPSRALVACMALVWAAAQAIMSGASAFGAALASRILLGAGEGGAFPLALHTGFAWVARERRSLATALVAIGSPLGVATGALVITFAIARYGWHGAFALLAVCSILWTGFWILFAPRLPRTDVQRHAVAVTGTPLKRLRTIAGATIAAFAIQWIFALATTWFPALLETAGALSSRTSGYILSIAWALQIPAFLATGWYSRRPRADVAALAVLVSGAALAGAGLAPHTPAAPILVILCIAVTAVAVTSLPPMVDDASAPQFRGFTLSALIGVASFGGLIAPALFGAVVDARRSGGYGSAAIVCGLLVMVAAAGAYALMERSKQKTPPSAQ